MKKLVLLLCGFLLIQCLYAEDLAKLRIKISGASSDNKYFLCVGNVGCVSILAGNQGKLYPMNNGDISYVYTTNVTNMRLYPQKLPESCNISVKNNQTVTVTGHIVKSSNQQIYISNLNCKLA